MSGLWGCIEEGRTTAIVGRRLPAAGRDWREVRVSCRGPHRHLGPILVARARIEDIIGHGASLREQLTDRLKAGVRRRLLGDAETQDRVWPLVEPLNKLAAAFEEPVALVFDGVEAADAATLQLLEEVVTHPGRVSVALVLVFERAPTQGPAAALLAAVKRVEGPRGLVGADQGPDTWAELQPVAPVTEDDRPPPRQPDSAQPPRSADPAIEDAPGANEPALGPMAPDARLVLRAAALAGPTFDADLVGRLLERPPLRVMEAIQQAVDAGYPVDDLGAGSFAMPPALAAVLLSELLPSLRDAWRSRLHQLVGPSAPDGFSSASEEAAALGAWPEAVSYARRAIALTEMDPDRAPGALCRLHLDLGRLLWQSMGAEGTLPEAMEELRAAEALLPPDAEPTLRAELSQTIAGICYDLADPASLEVGLEELSRAVRLLSANHHPIEAAALLNDQAALLVRMGDPLRAAGLLRQSRAIFETQGDDPRARIELAETDHLLARLPLHVAARPGHEEEALRRALEHAHTSEAAYAAAKLDRPRAHVWETMGRLLTLLDRGDEALDRLTRAFAAQDAMGDVLGMARTTAALADLKVASGDLAGGLTYLIESARLNAAKGAAQALGWNRETLARITAALPLDQSLALSPLVAAARAELEPSVRL